MAIFYAAIIERGTEGFGVFFPDVPGCISAGDTVQEAGTMAEEALRSHLMLKLESACHALDAIWHDPEIGEVATVLVRFDPPSKVVRVHSTQPQNQLDNIDAFGPVHSLIQSCNEAKEVANDPM